MAPLPLVLLWNELVFLANGFPIKVGGFDHVQWSDDGCVCCGGNENGNKACGEYKTSNDLKLLIKIYTSIYNLNKGKSKFSSPQL